VASTFGPPLTAAHAALRGLVLLCRLHLYTGLDDGLVGCRFGISFASRALSRAAFEEHYDRAVGAARVARILGFPSVAWAVEPMLQLANSPYLKSLSCENVSE